MNRRKLLTSLFILLFITGLEAQTVMNRDSLLLLLKTKKDSALVQLYMNIGVSYKANRIDSAKYYYSKALNLSKKINYVKGTVNAIAYYVDILNKEGKFKESLLLNKQAIVESKKSSNPFYMAQAYVNTGNCYNFTRRYEEAIKCFYISSKIFKKINKPNHLATVYQNIANLYNDLGQNDKCLLYNIKAEKIFRDHNLANGLCMVLNNKALVLISLKRFPEAEKALKESLKISLETKNDEVYASNLLNICDIKILTHKYDEIKFYAEKALKSSKRANSLSSIIISNQALSIYYLHQKQYDLAEKFALNSHNDLKIYENKEISKEIFILLSEISFAKQDIRKGLQFRIQADSIEDIMNLDETRNKIEELEIKYKTEKKELQIKNLTQENDIQNLKIKRRLWTTISLGVLLLVAGGFVFLQYKNFKTKKVLLLEQQKGVIAEERLRIASDMHDDVGTGLSRIHYIINSISQGVTPSKDGLKKITEISDDSISKMNEIIWALNENNQSLEELIYYIRFQASEMVDNSSINFNASLPENIPELDLGWMRNRNTFLLVRETLNNAIKHSEAKNISLNFEITSTTLTIRIGDDGKGFDTTKIYNGNGLNNYKKRIQKLKGTYSINSKENQGTIVVFTIPI